MNWDAIDVLITFIGLLIAGVVWVNKKINELRREIWQLKIDLEKDKQK